MVKAMLLPKTLEAFASADSAIYAMWAAGDQPEIRQRWSWAAVYEAVTEMAEEEGFEPPRAFRP
jgi:hypothetical protein